MAVLSGPPAGHVRRPGEAVAIVDIADDGTSLPPQRPPSRARGRLLAAAVGIVLGLSATFAPTPGERRESATGPVPSASPASVVRPSAATTTARAVVVRALALPAGVTDVDLTSMPERYLNDPLPPWFRIPLSVRGVPGLATAEAPWQIVWTEGDSLYVLTSRTREVKQLLDVAGALR